MNERIGIIAPLSEDHDVVEVVAHYGLSCFQVSCWDQQQFQADVGVRLRQNASSRGITVTSLWAGWPGPKVWDFVDGPGTLGIVPKEFRAERVAALALAGELAEAAEIPAVVTHLGFIPEHPGDPCFQEVVDAVGELAEGYRRRGLEFWFETGQETPVAMKRLIEAVGTGNLGVNLDPANLILYGKANPIDSVGMFGELIRSVHAKDGFYPTDPMKLGREVKVGSGAVDFPRFIETLEAVSYTGAYIIEREITGPEQEADIRATIDYLSAFL